MPHYNGVSAHIYTSTPLAEYPAPSDTASLFPVVSVYVEAQPGNYFSITCDALPSNFPNTIAFQSKIDGKNYHEGCSFRAGKKDSGVWIDNNAFQRYRFQDVKLVEERVLGMICREQAAGIGVIEVAVRRCTQKIIVKEIGEKEERKEKRDELKLKKSSMGGSPKKELAMFDMLHEKDAKGKDVGAMVSFGPPVYTARSNSRKPNDSEATTRTTIKLVDWQDSWQQPYVLFRFLYLKRDRLQAFGLIPTDPSEVQIRIEPEDPVVKEPPAQKTELKPMIKPEMKEEIPMTRNLVAKAKRERKEELDFVEIESVDLTDI